MPPPSIVDSALTRGFEPGQRVWVPGMGSHSAHWMQALQAAPERASGITFCGVLFPGVDSADYLALHPDTRLQAFVMTPAVRRGLAEGRAALHPLDYLGIARHLQEAEAPDVAVAHLTPPDADGWCQPGLGCAFTPLLWARARHRVAHLNPLLPRLPSSWRVHIDELDAWEVAESPVQTYAEAPAGEVERRIGAQVAPLVRDGDTLQFGLGAVPMALADALRHHRRLRLHGGMASAATRTLAQAGALCAGERITCGVVLGSAALHRWLAGLPTLWLSDVRQTHDPAAIAASLPRDSRFVAINSAVEVDLFGQVNAERAAGVLQAGAGGLPAYAAAAQATPGGRLLICLPSTARRGEVSRIVPALGPQGLCTVPRHLADAVVTEHGVAELRGRDVDERARALMAVADPAHRASLQEAWRQLRATL